MTLSRILKSANLFGYEQITDNVLKILCDLYHNDSNISNALPSYNKSLPFWKSLAKDKKVIY